MTRRERPACSPPIREADRPGSADFQDLQQLARLIVLRVAPNPSRDTKARGKNFTGLLEECPALSFTGRTITTPGEDRNTVRRPGTEA